LDIHIAFRDVDYPSNIQKFSLSKGIQYIPFELKTGNYLMDFDFQVHAYSMLRCDVYNSASVEYPKPMLSFPFQGNSKITIDRPVKINKDTSITVQCGEQVNLTVRYDKFSKARLLFDKVQVNISSQYGSHLEIHNLGFQNLNFHPEYSIEYKVPFFSGATINSIEVISNGRQLTCKGRTLFQIDGDYSYTLDDFCVRI
jgi:hypothetical protein